MDKPSTNLDGRPRLLILATLAEAGGVVTYLRNLLPALGGFEVTVAAYGAGPLQAAVEEAGGRYVSLRHVRRPPHPLRDLAGMLELIRLFRRVRPQIVHANSSKAGVLGRLAAAVCRVPIRIFTVHGWAFAWFRPRFLYLWPDRLVSPLTTMTICVAEAARDLGVSAGACDPKRTVVIPNGIPLPPRRAARPAGVTSAAPVVLSVGRLAAAQGLQHADRCPRLRQGSVQPPDRRGRPRSRSTPSAHWSVRIQRQRRDPGRTR